MQNLVLDIGNTSIKYGIFEGDALVKQGQFQELGELPAEVLQQPYRNAIIATVAGNTDHIKARLLVQSKLIELSAQTALPVINEYKTPETLGVDRIAAAVGAHYFFRNRNCLVIDAGTCITYEFITDKGAYQGGGIAPGIGMKFKALHTFTKRLPLLEQISEEYPLTGQTTQESIQSGVLNGTVAELNGIIQQYAAKAANLVVILCGGDTRFFESKLKGRIFAIPELVLIGLHRILMYNV